MSALASSVVLLVIAVAALVWAEVRDLRLGVWLAKPVAGPDGGAAEPFAKEDR